MMVFISNGKLHVSAYSGHHQVLISCQNLMSVNVQHIKLFFCYNTVLTVR